MGGRWRAVGGWRVAVGARRVVKAVRVAELQHACGRRVEAAWVGHQCRLGHAHQYHALHRALRCVSVAHAQGCGCVGVGLDDVHRRR